MSLSALWTLQAVKVGATTIGQITDQRTARGVQQIVEASSGLPRPTLAAVMAAQPMAAWTTSDIVAGLTACPVTGRLLASGASALVLYWQQYAHGGTRTGGSTDKIITVSNGIAVPRVLTIEQDRVATLTCEAFAAAADGITDPFVVTTGAVATGTVDDIKHTLGKVMINGSQLTGVNRVTIDFGLSLKVDKRFDGDQYPSICAIEKVQPVIKIRTGDVATAFAYGAALAQGATASIIYARKMAKGGVRVANATAEHVSLTFNAGLFFCDEVAGNDPGEQMAEVTLLPTYNGTNEPIVVATATAIA